MPGLAMVLLLFGSLGRARRVVTTIYEWNFRQFFYLLLRDFSFSSFYISHMINIE